MEKKLLIKVIGKVQGVGFRFESYQQFVDLGLSGKAENSEDGSLSIEVSGPEENLQKFIDWAHKGPIGAKVERVIAEESKNNIEHVARED